MSFAVEVQTDRTGNWYGNQCRYPTQAAAEKAAVSLFNRWTLVQAHRVVESSDPANYDYIDGRNEPYKEPT